MSYTACNTEDRPSAIATVLQRLKAFVATALQPTCNIDDLPESVRLDIGLGDGRLTAARLERAATPSIARRFDAAHEPGRGAT